MARNEGALVKAFAREFSASGWCGVVNLYV
jgi:hypothetical protein